MATLRNRLTSGARWTLSIRIVERVIGFASTLILARLLAPDDFGVVAMGTVIQGILMALTEFGFTKALIRMRRPPRAAYDTAFTLNVITGVGIAAIMVVLIPLAQHWYEDARVAPVLISLGLISLASSFRNAGLAKYERVMDFQPFFKIALARKLAAVGVGAVIALTLGDYRALLGGMAAGAVIEVALSYRLSRYRPRFTLSMARELMGFSLWWLGAEAMTMINRRGTDLFVGQQLGAMTLGQYSVAYDLATLPTSEIVAPVMRAVFPGYMQMKDEAGRLHSAFIRVWGVIALTAVPCAVGMACLADLMTTVVLGTKWIGAAPLLGTLAAVGALQALHACYWPMLLTRRGPKTVFMLTAWGVVLTLPVFWIFLVNQGLQQAIISGIVVALIMLVVGAHLLLKDLGASGWPLLAALVRPALSAAAMAWAIGVVRGMLPASQSWAIDLIALLSLVGLGVVVYAAAVFGLWLLSGRPIGAESEMLHLISARLAPGRARP